MVGLMQRTLEVEGKVCYLTSFGMSAVNYDRSEFLELGTGELGLTDEYEIKLAQVLIWRTDLLELQKSLADWVDDHKPIQVSMGHNDSQFLSLAICLKKDFICRPDRPVAVIGHGSFRMQSEVRFVVDQSCVRQCGSVLDEFLRLH